jgi:phage terminase large subunit GpA-like protein
LRAAKKLTAQRPHCGRAAVQIQDSKFKTKQKGWFLTEIFARCEETQRTETTARQSRNSNSRFKIQDKAKRMVSDGNFCALRRNSAHRDHSAAEPQFKFKIQNSRQSKKNGF